MTHCFYSFVSVVCGGVIEKEKGFIQSPNYPEYYEMNKNCTWRIIVPKVSKEFVFKGRTG